VECPRRPRKPDAVAALAIIVAKPNLFQRPGCVVIMNRAILFAVIVFLSEMTAVAAAPLRIVAIGASNTQGWYVGNQGAYPAKLQALLKAKGIDAQVINAGVPFDTTAGMLKRIDSDVSTGTDIVIVYDEEIPLRHYTFDFIHLTGEGHAMIAATLLPRIMAIINRRPNDALPSSQARQP
jgi:acyl-CoA thioesterase I